MRARETLSRVCLLVLSMLYISGCGDAPTLVPIESLLIEAELLNEQVSGTDSSSLARVRIRVANTMPHVVALRRCEPEPDRLWWTMSVLPVDSARGGFYEETNGLRDLTLSPGEVLETVRVIGPAHIEPRMAGSYRVEAGICNRNVLAGVLHVGP